MEHTVVTQVDLIFWCVWKRGISQSGQSGEWNMGKHIGNHESVRKHQSWASLSPDKPGRVFFSRSRYWGNTGRGFGGFGPDDFIAGLNDDSSSSKDFWLVNGYNPTRWCCIYSISCIHPQYFFLDPCEMADGLSDFYRGKFPSNKQRILLLHVNVNLWFFKYSMIRYMMYVYVATQKKKEEYCQNVN